MALDENILKGEIKNAFCGINEKESLDRALNGISEKLAKAIITHIKNNLEVTVEGLGYQGFKVVSKNKPNGSVS